MKKSSKDPWARERKVDYAYGLLIKKGIKAALEQTTEEAVANLKKAMEK